MILLILAEGLMLVLNQRLYEIYLTIALAFLIGFLLRALRLYPGQDEPLILDFSAFCFALIYAFLGGWLINSPWRFLLILCSSLIIMPHFIYIIQEK